MKEAKDQSTLIMAHELDQLRPYFITCAYNILGIVAEAEDIVQDAYIKYLGTDKSMINNTKAYLARIVVNMAINRKRRMKRLLTDYPGEWLPEPLSTEDADKAMNRKDALSYSLMVLMEKLSPTQRAVFILREAYDYDHTEIAEVLGISEDNCRQLLSRARKQLGATSVNRHEPEIDFLDKYIQLMQTNNTAALEALMNEEIRLISDGGGKAKAAVNPLHGKETIVTFLLGLHKKFHSKLTAKFGLINHEPALIFFEGGQAVTCQVLCVTNGVIDNVFFIRNPDKLKSIFY
jgi:RNA polymerase sigma factor (sigma-70 family)